MEKTKIIVSVLNLSDLEKAIRTVEKATENLSDVEVEIHVGKG